MILYFVLILIYQRLF